jgi:hypothetical protein
VAVSIGASFININFYRTVHYAIKRGSSLLSVGGRDPEFSGSKVEHGEKVVGGSEPPSLTFDCREDAVQGFEERVGRFVSPMSEDSLKVTLNHTGAFDHRMEQQAGMLFGNATDPEVARQNGASGTVTRVPQFGATDEKVYREPSQNPDRLSE